MNQTSLGTILLVCTSHAELGTTGKKTGFWMEELAAPYYAFMDAGYEVSIASPKGGKPPVDPGSLTVEMRGPSVNRFEADPDAVAALSDSIPLSEIADIGPYAGIFLVGGHGSMWDFPHDKALGRLLIQSAAQGKAIGAVCHGAAGLLVEGLQSALRGKSVTGFSNEEEAAVGLIDVVPFLIESKLVDAGFNYRAGAIFTPQVVTDGNLVTGQNPASSAAAANGIISVLTNTSQ